MRPNPAFLPKVLSSSQLSQDIEVRSLYSTGEGHRRHSLVCPVRALRMYLQRTRNHRRTDQLFVCFRPDLRGQPLSKARLSHWLVGAIKQAYIGAGVLLRSGVRAHSTRGMATSWASWRGESLDEICAAATWSAPSTFARFYQFNVAASTLFGERVLGVASGSKSGSPVRQTGVGLTE